MDIYTIVGEQLFDFVGPFDEAESPAGEIVFGSEVIGFFDCGAGSNRSGR